MLFVFLSMIKILHHDIEDQNIKIKKKKFQPRMTNVWLTWLITYTSFLLSEKRQGEQLLT